MAPSLKCVLVVGPEEAAAVRDRLENRLKSTWSWLFSALDALEAQLRFGHALLGSQDQQQMFGLTSSATNRQSSSAAVGASSRPAIPQRYGTTADGEQLHSGSARKDFVGYLLSLMRAHSSEHGDDLPVIDYGSLRPVAHIVDSLFALMDAVSRADTPPPDAVNLADLFDQYADQEGESSSSAETPNESSMRRFFQRSKSLLYPGVSTRLGAFEHSISDSLPLADKPHLLRPETSKERMFGVPGKSMVIADHKEAARDTGNPNVTHQSLAEPMAAVNRVGETTPTQSTSRSAPVACPDTPVTSAVRTVLSSTVDMAAAVSSPTKRPNVIVHAKSASADKGKAQKMDTAPPPGVARVTLAQIAGLSEKNDDNGAQILMGRWKRSLTLLAKVFHEDLSSYVPSEQSVLAQMAGFIVRETKFRKEMERVRGSQSKDLVMEVDRERHLLIQQTIKQLNQAFQRRSSCAVAGTAPLAVHKVKVTFKEEPGEGTGVARSFYAAVAEAFLTIERLPNLELCQATPGGAATGIGGRAQQQHFLNRMRTRERTREFHRRRTGATTRRYPLSADAPPFYLSGGGEEGAPVTNWDPSKQTLGERLLPRVRQLRPSLSNKITGMLLELPPHQLIALLTSEESLRAHVEDAVDQITANMNPGDIRDESSQDAMDVAQHMQGQDQSATAPLSPSKSRKSVSTPNLHGLNPVLDPDEIQDTAPLFYQPGKAGFYSPVPGKNSAERINAFRNVGRLMGICLLQNELLPIHLCRHVFKYILDRPVNWYDLAFFDPSLFESLRSLATHDRDSFEDLHLTFSINVAEEEGGGVIDLKANGSNIPVTGENVVEYVYRYVEMRMLKNVAKALEAMKQGVYDVLPSDALKGLSAEDLRLILCGTHEISIRLLQSYTSFADESSAPADQLARFKRWF
uniref:HECT domain-containing protein n=1 Tax=Plectus sambesii TaxID=2011161 RepID=A0A914X892_9BILA